MGIRVCKFGGSSVADAGQMRKVRAIVEAEPERRFIVPSAPGKRDASDIKVTDLFYSLQKAAGASLQKAAGASLQKAAGARSNEVEDLSIWTERIADRFREIIRDLEIDPAFWSDEFEPALDEIFEQIRQGAGADYAASRGEYLSGRVLARLLDRPFIDPAEIIHFDATGRFLPEQTHRSVRDRLAAEESGVIPGFYGARPDGTIKTFSRGGSDITGAIIARGAGASVYENWTDVPGLLMTDPRVVDDPRTIEALTYRELRELAYMGATVLHEEAIFPVREAGIPVHIRDTNHPDAKGTRISRETTESEAPSGRITGIAGRKDFTIIALEKTLMNAEVGFGRRLLSVLEDQDISWEHMPSGIDTLSIVIKNEVLDGRLEALQAAIEKECQPDTFEVNSDIALIATVGRGMSHVPGTAARLFRALAEAGVNIRMIDQGSSELNIIVGVENDDFERAVRAIYEAFVE